MRRGKNATLYLLGMLIVGIAFGLTTVVADTIMNSNDVAYKTTTVKAALDDLYGLTADDIWQKIYPIGSIYTSVDSTSPETLFGGTWEVFGQGRTLVGVGSNGTTIYEAGSIGGSETKTIAVGNLPSHAHTYTPGGTIGNTGGGGSHTHGVSNTSTTRTSNANNRGHTHSGTTAGGGSHKHDWKGSLKTRYQYNANSTERTFAVVGTDPLNQSTGGMQSVGNHTHTFTTGDVSQNHTHTYADYYANTTSGGTTLTIAQMPAHNHSFTGTASSTTGCTNCSGTALNVQNPYITVYMWKRTA